MGSTERPAWADDDPATVNIEMVPPAQRGSEALAAGTQLRSEVLQGAYLVVLVAAPAVTVALRATDTPDEVADRVGALLLVLALITRMILKYRSPDGSWVRNRRDLETANSQAWLRVTGRARAGDSVRCRALDAADVAERWACYRRFRIGDQLAYFVRRGDQHERAAKRMRAAQVVLAVIALAAAIWQATQLRQTPLVGLVVALLAAVEAWTQFRRSAFIAANYAEAAAALEVEQARQPADEQELAEVVDGVERLLEKELWTWVAISSTSVLIERRRS